MDNIPNIQERVKQKDTTVFIHSHCNDYEIWWYFLQRRNDTNEVIWESEREYPSEFDCRNAVEGLQEEFNFVPGAKIILGGERQRNPRPKHPSFN